MPVSVGLYHQTSGLVHDKDVRILKQDAIGKNWRIDLIQPMNRISAKDTFY